MVNTINPEYNSDSRDGFVDLSPEDYSYVDSENVGDRRDSTCSIINVLFILLHLISII